VWCVCVCVWRGGDEREWAPILIWLFRQQVKVNWQTEKNAVIKYDKDTRKIKNKFIFFFSWKLNSLLLRVKPIVFGTALDREPGFKTVNLIKYWIQCRHYGGACVWGGYNRSLCHPILCNSKFAVLLKTVFTFIHKTNDAIVSKFDHTFLTKLCAVDGR